MKLQGFAAAAAMVFAAAAAQGAQAATIDWTQWGPFNTAGGTASGTAGGVGVSFSGEVENLFTGYPSWGPAGSYVGGTVSNAPPAAGGIVQQFGGNGAVINTITFSQAETNPVIAIWSLGQGGINASYNFINAPFTIEAGGPSNEYGGASITASGDTVFGSEGNGVIQFQGTFNSISWTNPTFENWYGFTVGVDAVPEPASWAMMLVGVGAIGAAMRRSRKVGAVVA